MLRFNLKPLKISKSNIVIISDYAILFVFVCTHHSVSFQQSKLLNETVIKVKQVFSLFIILFQSLIDSFLNKDDNIHKSEALKR